MTAAGRVEAVSPRSGGSTLWSATALVFVGNTLARGLGFLFPIVLAHSMDRHDFALVYLFINMGFFTGELVLTGFPTAMARQIASEKVPSERERGFRQLSSAGFRFWVFRSSPPRLLPPPRTPRPG